PEQLCLRRRQGSRGYLPGRTAPAPAQVGRARDLHSPRLRGHAHDRGLRQRAAVGQPRGRGAPHARGHRAGPRRGLRAAVLGRGHDHHPAHPPPRFQDAKVVSAAALRAAPGARMAASGALLVLLAAGIALRFYRLGEENFWFDELWTAVVSDPSLPLSQLMRIWILPDVHPPLYYLMLREWRTWFGSDEWWLRLPSAVSGVLTVAVVPLVQRWLPVVRRPLVLAAWLAASTGGIVYAQEARHYTLLLFMATAATLIATGLAHRIARGGSILVPALVLAAVTTVLEYVHYFGVLLTAGLFTALYLFARVHRDRAAERIVLAAGTASLLLF